MSAFYTLLFVAPTSDAESIANDVDEDANERYPNAWLDHIGDLELIELWNILQPGVGAETLLDEMVFASPDGETVVVKVPVGFVEAVNSVSSNRVNDIATQWQASELMADWPLADVVGVFDELSAVCRKSVETATPLLQVAAM
nr:putative integron gene cassette protein [uncultured bacterium]